MSACKKQKVDDSTASKVEPTAISALGSRMVRTLDLRNNKSNLIKDIEDSKLDDLILYEIDRFPTYYDRSYQVDEKDW